MSDSNESFLPPQPKPRPGSLPLKPRPKKPDQPRWDGIDPAVRAEYERRVAVIEAQRADPVYQAELAKSLAAIREASPPWGGEWPPPLKHKPPETTNLKKLKAARKKVEEYSAVLRSDAFDDWLRRCTQPAQEPREWTRARTLYESYRRHAKAYGNNRPDKRLAKETLASETAWGKMMGSLFPHKQRRSRPNGWHYPLRLKQGA